MREKVSEIVNNPSYKWEWVSGWRLLQCPVNSNLYPLERSREAEQNLTTPATGWMNIVLRFTAAAAAKSLQLCLTAAHQAPPSLGFSRQEHWSGLPFPSPMHESEKWKWSRSVVSNSSRPHGLQPTRLLSPWDFPGKSTGVGCHCLLCLRFTSNIQFPIQSFSFLQ